MKEREREREGGKKRKGEIRGRCGRETQEEEGMEEGLPVGMEERSVALGADKCLHTLTTYTGVTELLLCLCVYAMFRWAL